MPRRLAILGVLFTAALLPFQSVARHPQPASQVPVFQPPIVSYLVGHTTTFRALNPEAGPIHVSLAILPDGTGWLYNEPGPGGTLKPRLRYIYRWWISQETGNFCYLYSPEPERMTERSFWRCLVPVQGPDGVPTFAAKDGSPLPIISRVPGNALEARARSFLEIVTTRNGGRIPVPQDPVTPPPR
jgi:hypothetical protein